MVLLTQPGKWTFLLLANQIWSTSGAKDRAAVNQMYLQPAVNYNLGGGLAVGVSMEATGNWKATEVEVWSAPLLYNISKVALLANSRESDGGRGPLRGQPDRRLQLAVSLGGIIPVPTITPAGSSPSR